MCTDKANDTFEKIYNLIEKIGLVMGHYFSIYTKTGK